MTLQELINTTTGIKNALFTGVLTEEKCNQLARIISPQSFDAVGTLVDMSTHMGDIEYRYAVFGEKQAAKYFSNVDIVCVLNNNRIKPGQELVDAWLPIINSGGYLVCFNQHDSIGTYLEKANENTTDYPPNWYRQA